MSILYYGRSCKVHERTLPGPAFFRSPWRVLILLLFCCFSVAYVKIIKNRVSQKTDSFKGLYGVLYGSFMGFLWSLWGYRRLYQALLQSVSKPPEKSRAMSAATSTEAERTRTNISLSKSGRMTMPSRHTMPPPISRLLFLSYTGLYCSDRFPQCTRRYPPRPDHVWGISKLVRLP